MVFVTLVRTMVSPGRGPVVGLPRARNLLLAMVAALAVWGVTMSAALAAGPSSGYRVQKGDTLWSIATRSGVSVSKLVALNGLADANHILIGQTLTFGGSPVMFHAPGPAPLISAPYIRQFDGTPYADSNCGPASLAMALAAVKIQSDPVTLRHLAAHQMGFDNPGGGTTWDSLAYAARVKGATVQGLVSGHHYRVWSVDDLKQEFAKGHPVILLVRYRTLPDHQGSDYWGDHYILGLGFDQAGNLIYHDPAFRTGSGADRKISQDLLIKAWSDTSVHLTRTAMAISR